MIRAARHRPGKKKAKPKPKRHIGGPSKPTRGGPQPSQSGLNGLLGATMGKFRNNGPLSGPGSSPAAPAAMPMGMPGMMGGGGGPGPMPPGPGQAPPPPELIAMLAQMMGGQR